MSLPPGSGLRWAYNTNGLSSHRLDDALVLLAEHGYAGVALTLDVAHHDPFAPDLAGRTAALADRLDGLGLGSVVETGARFLLDPRRKHHPTLVSADAADRARRVGFLRLCVDVAADLGSEAVSFWAGVLDEGLDRDEAWKHVVDGVGEVADHARGRGVAVAVEPEPGMLVDDLDDWTQLHAAVPGITLALDTGHCIVSGRWDPADAVRAFAGSLGAVAVEDMPRGVHDHRAPGEGDMDLGAVVGALREVGHRGLVSLELSRDSHRADRLVPSAIATLRALEGR